MKKIDDYDDDDDGCLGWQFLASRSDFLHAMGGLSTTISLTSQKTNSQFHVSSDKDQVGFENGSISR